MAALLRLRVARDLWLFLAARRRRPEFTEEHDGTASLGHVVQSCGVPLPEVGRLRVDGVAVSPRMRAPHDAVVEVDAVVRPQHVSAYRFLLDVHLGTVARRLRLLGVNAAWRNDASDPYLVRRATEEGRVLLTQDRGLLCRRALPAGAYVRGARPEQQLTDVLDRFAPPLHPWTRCLSCNGVLVAVAKREVLDRLEPGTRRSYDKYARCATCGQVYWRGAHARGLAALIDRVRAAHPELLVDEY